MAEAVMEHPENKKRMTLNDILALTETAEESATKELSLLMEKTAIAPAADEEDLEPLFGIDAMKLQAQIAKGMDYDQRKNTNLSNWSKVCFHGDYAAVKQLLYSRSADERKALIEKKESLMRFSALFHVVKGACERGAEGHVKVARLLLESGASPHARDVGGSTPLHYCTSQFGNATTLAIAKLLVAGGADVNTRNRFGATALFEPCITRRYEFVEFLVLNRCNPAITENFGVSCYSYASLDPRLRSIFSKGAKVQAELDCLQQGAIRGAVVPPSKCSNCRRVVSKRVGCNNCTSVLYCSEICQAQHWNNAHQMACVACSHCGLSEGPLRKCSGCKAAQYCSVACQRADWKNHKRACREGQAVEAGNWLCFKPVPVKREKEEEETEGNAKDRKAKVKIEIVYDTKGVRSDYPMSVSDKSRSYQTCILPTEPDYAKLFSLIAEKGYGAVTMYFEATIKRTGELLVNYSSSFPETW